MKVKVRVWLTQKKAKKYALCNICKNNQRYQIGLGFFHYSVLEKIDFFYFSENFILGTLLQLDCCNLLFTRHDTLSQNGVLTQNVISWSLWRFGVATRRTLRPCLACALGKVKPAPIVPYQPALPEQS